jgi:putative transposase
LVWVIADVYSMEIASADTRRRALAAYGRGGKTQPEVAVIFGVTMRTFQRWWRAWREEGRDAPGERPGRPRTFVGSAEAQLRQALADQPDATLHELAERVGNIASHTTVHRALERWDLPLKKRRCEPQSRTDPM